MARFGNSYGLSEESSFLEPKSGQKSQIWPPCDQIALANWIIYMNLHFKQRKIFARGGNRPTILSVSQLLSVKYWWLQHLLYLTQFILLVKLSYKKMLIFILLQYKGPAQPWSNSLAYLNLTTHIFVQIGWKCFVL